MQIHRGYDLALPGGCAVTIGNFDGVHRGHQAMLALLTSEARHRGLPACVLSFQPHPRDFFARLARSRDFFARLAQSRDFSAHLAQSRDDLARRPGEPAAVPARIATLRDKATALERCGVDHLLLVRFDQQLASMAPQRFVDRVLKQGLNARYVLVGDDFTFGARRAGNYTTLDQAGTAAGFDVARMMSYEVHGNRVSSSAVREALAAGDMARAEALLGRPYSISGHVQHGRKLGRELGFPTLNLAFGHPRPAASGIFVVQVHGLAGQPLPGVASVGVRPTVEDSGRVLVEAHCLQWPGSLGSEGGYGKCVRVELLHKLHDELKYPSLQALQDGIAADTAAARAWWAAR